MKAALDAVRAGSDAAARREADPVGFVHRFADPLDQELVGLLAACLAFGNVKAIRQKLGEALERVGARPARAAARHGELSRALEGWVHRVYRGEDIARLLAGAARVQREAGTLGSAFAAELAGAGELREALARFCDRIRAAGGFPLRPYRPGDRRGPGHLLPDPRGTSSAKRLHLYLRWMVRPADGVDLGLWPVSPAVLLCPVDVHIHKLSQNLGLTTQNQLTWRAAEEITAHLRRFDPDDPVKYDFSLCHLGMLQRCPSRRDAARCEGCGVLPVCRHWARARRGAPPALGKAPLPLVG